MDIDDLIYVIAKQVDQYGTTADMEIVSCLLELKELRAQTAKSELSRTELIKQNAALAAENERLESVIKAAQEQECDADRYRFIRSIGGITWTLSNKQDGELLRYRAEDEAYDSLVDEEIKARGFILKAHPVPTQSPETHELIRFDYINADGREDSKMITHDEMRQRYSDLRMSNYMPRPAVAVPDGYRIEIDSDGSVHLMDDCAKCATAIEDPQLIRFFTDLHAATQSHDRCPSHEPLHPVLQAYGVQDSGVVDHD